MDSTESPAASSVEDSLDTKNLEASMQDIVVAKYDDYNSEVSSSQNDEDQSGEQQVLAYIEVEPNLGSEDATMFLNSQLNAGQRLIFSQTDDGILVFVGEDPDGQPQFAHASVLHSNEINFEDDLKEHSPLVVDEHSQSLELVETEEVSEEPEERHVYIENSGGIINISSENQCSPVSIESPLWSVSNSAQLKSDNNSEMVFIPNPTVVQLAPQETKHPKLMQLACIAHELESASQKNSSMTVDGKFESPLTGFESSVIVTQSDAEKNSRIAFAVPISESAECLPSSENDDTDFEPAKSAADVSSLLSYSRVIDNTVSVIHTTSSEVADSSVGDHSKPNSPDSPDFTSVKNFHSPENELPSDIMHSSNTSRESFHDNLNESSNLKPIEEYTRDDLEENSRLSMTNDSNESASIINNNSNNGLELGPVDDDSPLTFIEKSEKLDVGTLGIEDDPLEDTEMRVDENSPGSCMIAVEEEGGCKEDSNMSGTARDSSELENLVLKDTDKDYMRNVKAPSEVDSVIENDLDKDADNYESSKNEAPSDSDNVNDDTVNMEQAVATSKNLFPFTSKHLYLNAKHMSLDRNLVSPPQEDKRENDTPSLSQLSKDEELDTKTFSEDSRDVYDENSKSEPMDFENSPAENLIIAESADDEEFASDTAANDSVGKSESLTLRRESGSEPTKDVEMSDSENFVLAHDISRLPDRKSETVDCNDPKLLNSVTAGVECNNTKDSEDFSFVEETFVKPPKKTYIRKRNTFENKPYQNPLPRPIELFSVDDLDFSGCDKDISEMEKSLMSDQSKEMNDTESSLNSHQQNESPSKDTTDSNEDHLLLSGVQSKVSATYTIKRKSLPPKPGLRSQSLRLRSLPSKLPVENGTFLDNHSKKDSFDSNSSENAPWRLWTSKDDASTSFGLLSSTFSSTPSKQSSYKINKSKRDFDRLLNSPSSVALRQNKSKQFSPRGRSGQQHSKFFRGKKCQSAKNAKKFRILKKRKAMDESDRLKESRIEYLSYDHAEQQRVTRNDETESPKNDETESPKNDETQSLRNDEILCPRNDEILSPRNDEILSPRNNVNQSPRNNETCFENMFSCSGCNFVSVFVDNLIEHLKYCKTKGRSSTLNYSVNDMDKRQRIRGEEATTFKTVKEVTEFVKLSMKEISKIQAVPDIPLRLKEDADEADFDLMKKRAHYGYGEDDVVWVKFKDRFWPALIIHLDRVEKKKRAPLKRKKNNAKVCTMKEVAHVWLISYPEEVKGLKVRHENIRTFDDFKWNLLCLTEAENLEHNEIFVKAVQRSEVFMRRKFLGLQVKGKEFFSVRDEVDFTTDNASSDCINEDSDSEDMDKASWKKQTARQARYDKLDIDKIMTYILEGQTDDYVRDIYSERCPSTKHKDFFDTLPVDSYPLRTKVWFGPCEEKSQKDRLFAHFQDLFQNCIGDMNYVIPYVLQVWIPEALVKAISVIKNIPLEDAEILFESEDSLDLDDPNMEDIEKLYS